MLFLSRFFSLPFIQQKSSKVVSEEGGRALGYPIQVSMKFNDFWMNDCFSQLADNGFFFVFLLQGSSTDCQPSRPVDMSQKMVSSLRNSSFNGPARESNSESQIMSLGPDCNYR